MELQFHKDSSIPNAILAGALTQLGATQATIATINSIPSLAPFSGIVQSTLSNPVALLGALAAQGNSSGLLGRPTDGGFAPGEGYNVFNGQPLPAGSDTGAAVLNTLSSFEVGYKGVIGDKLSVAVTSHL